MKPEDLAKWVAVGADIIGKLGVPVAAAVSALVQLFLRQGGTKEQALELASQWAGLLRDVEARIALLKAAIAVLDGSDR